MVQPLMGVFMHGTFPKPILSYFVALIHKIKSLQKLGEYRPIFLLGCLYRVIAKILNARLRKVIRSAMEKVRRWRDGD